MRSFSSKSTLLLYHAGAAIAVIGWGISFISTKVLLGSGLNPIEIYIYRFAIAYLALLIFSHKRIRSNSWRHELLFMLGGMVGGSVYFKLNPLGDLLSLLAAFCWAIYSIILKRVNPLYSALFITRKTFFYGVITALPFLLIESEIASPSVLMQPKLLLNLLFLALYCSMFAYLLWAMAIGKLGAVKANNYMYFQPVVTLVFSFLILGEKISAVGYTGCAMILLGVWMSDYLQQRKLRVKNK